MQKELPQTDTKLLKHQHILLPTYVLIYTPAKLHFPAMSAVPLKNSGAMPEVHGLFICCMIFTEKITSELSRLEYIYACGKSGIPPLLLDKSRK